MKNRQHILGLVILILLLAMAYWAHADGPNRVGLVIAHGNGEVVTECLSFSEETINGLDLLERLALDISYEVAGQGAAICRLDGEGCNFPAETCFCECRGASCIFWSYWHLIDGAWVFSNRGADSYTLHDGDVEGWAWGAGQIGQATPPPLISFDQICAAPLPTDTSTFTPTQTEPPPATPIPVVTKTSTPQATPVIHYFTAERQTIHPGETVMLNWDLEGARAAYLRQGDVEEGVIAPGNKTVAPQNTTVYHLVAYNDSGGEAVAEITIIVNPATLTPTFTPSPIPALPAPPTNTPWPTPTEIIATPEPEPVILFQTDQTALIAGECATLFWQIDHAETVQLNDVPTTMQGTEQVCPIETTTYYLHVTASRHEQVAQLTLNVILQPTPPTSTPTFTPIPATVTPLPSPIALLPKASNTETVQSNINTSNSQVDSPQATQADNGSTSLFYGSAIIILCLFIIVPIGLLALGWSAWWLRRR